MTDSQATRAPSSSRPPIRRRSARLIPVFVILFLLLAAPWWTIVSAPSWPLPVLVAGSVVFVAAYVALPVSMTFGHGRRHVDRAAVLGDALLGVIWVLFVWSLLSQLAGVALLFAGVPDPLRARVVALTVVVVVIALLAWGWVEAMRVPRVRRVEVTVPRLGAGLDGLKVVVLSDTHFGPIDRARWSAGVVERVNELDADVVCLVGDIADGTAVVREPQARPLASVRARLARVYSTGNHEYISEAQGWLDYMAEIGWDTLHNRHIVVERDGSRLVVAGVDDRTARGSGLAGHGANIEAALRDSDSDLPVMLLAHQPKQIVDAVAAGVDLQLSGHTHGGQIWPFNFLVRLDQPVVHGLSSHGERTQLYTSRGTGFWGPPFRVFAPSEITLLTLRTADVSERAHR